MGIHVQTCSDENGTAVGEAKKDHDDGGGDMWNWLKFGPGLGTDLELLLEIWKSGSVSFTVFTSDVQHPLATPVRSSLTRESSRFVAGLT